MKIRMICLDLDGTLLNEQKVLTEETKQALKEAIDKGIEIVPATGRALYGIPKEIRTFPGVRYALTANGARIVEIASDKILYEKLISKNDAKKVLNIMEQYDTLREVYFCGHGYVQEDMKERLDQFYENPEMLAYVKGTRKYVTDLHALIALEERGLDKMQAVFRKARDRDVLWKHLQEETDLSVTGALKNNVEVNAPQVHKGTGLAELARLLQIPMEEVMACGDGRNDIEMIRQAGIGVAMENGVRGLKEAADYITLTNDENGVAKAIRKFALQ